MEHLIHVIQEQFPVKTIEDIEKNDPMYQALIYLHEHLENKEMFLPLTVANSMVCYQLSSNGEAYWQEFANEASKYTFHRLKDIYLFFIDFLPKSEGNKRLATTKIERLKRLNSFLSDFYFKQKFYQKNMVKFRKEIARTMSQLEGAKTVVFTVKMFGYGARIRFGQYIEFPREIPIPVDSRLQLIYKNINADENLSIENFYGELATRLDVAPLHLDAILWLNHTYLIDEVLKRKEK